MANSKAVHKVCIGAATRNRREMLSNLLSSFVSLEKDERFEMTFVIVENNSQETLSDVIQDFQNRVQSSKVVYVAEPKIGIPFARNRVLQIALNEECDFAAFIDDDETADTSWIKNLYQEMIERDLDLAGGLVRHHPLEKGASALQETLWRGVIWQGDSQEREILKRHTAGEDGRLTIYTSNWMCRTSFLKRTGLTFNENLVHSGGTDSVFFHKAKALGAKTGKTPAAIVNTEVPLTRLTVRYRFCRGRDQAIAAFPTAFPQLTAWVVLRVHYSVIRRSLRASWLFFLCLFDRGKRLSAALHTLGFAYGRLCALFGRKSRHYESTHGH